MLKIDNYSNQKMLQCLYCLSGQTIKFLPLKQILDSNQSTLFKGWPILDDSEIYDQLMLIPQKEELIKQRIQDVQIFYKLLRDEINLLIDKKEKDSLVNIEKRYQSFEYPLDLYNRICQKAKLKDIILNQYKDFHNQNQAFSLIVKENIEKQKVYQEQMLNSLKTFQGYKVDLVSQNQIKEQIIQLINQINDFSIAQENKNILQVSQNSRSKEIKQTKTKQLKYTHSKIFTIFKISKIQKLIYGNLINFISNLFMENQIYKKYYQKMKKMYNEKQFSKL
ncbi:kinase domain protein (macronuclear) [Tetrahymena thermophila SB210]|uniref:Kinase domain protein n=1 Tax=Tetrahymena thermophila (strain SB210) TaxID=312017 RepID=W7XL23_TETTS|nr:kinase domain protein [Tetrahymena thermophila SB210]EWS75539.1 kinase domain protein [Tetrahymena thermophila SB210]|eukprot:XP_012651927.1 kinase domain protein [Tetrahymena thermophila SB210]